MSEEKNTETVAHLIPISNMILKAVGNLIEDMKEQRKELEEIGIKLTKMDKKMKELLQEE